MSSRDGADHSHSHHSSHHSRHSSSRRHRSRSRSPRPRSRDDRRHHRSSSSGRHDEAEQQRPLSRWERMEQEDQEAEQQRRQHQQQQQHTADLSSRPQPRQQQQQQHPQQLQAFNSPADSQALVLQMMQAPSQRGAGPAVSTGTTNAAAAQPQHAATGKQQLWGAKRDAAAAGVAPAFGANRWDLAEFASQQQTLKFQRLLGAHKAAAGASSALHRTQQQPPSAAAAAAGQDVTSHARVLSKEEQQHVLTDVERQFNAGLRRAGGRTVGLGS